MRRIATAIISLLFFAACSDSEPMPQPPLYGQISIAHLRTMARSDSYTISDDISIEGYVIANDLYGEFYKSIILGDGSGCIEVEIESQTLRTLFPISARVTVQCSGLALGDYGGSISLGGAADGKYAVSRIEEKDILRYFYIDTENPQAIPPKRVKIHEIDSSLIGDYILLEDVTFRQQAGMSWCDKDADGKWVTTERTIYDNDGHSLNIRTIAECRYAEEKIPAGRGNLCGIVGYFNGKYSLRIVNHQIIF